MVEEKSRTLKVLEALSKMTEPSSPADIGIIIEVSPRDTGKALYDLGKGGLAQKPDEKQSLWLITDKGRKYIENPPVLSERPLEPTLEPTTQADLAEEVLIVPPQSDLFRSIGEKFRGAPQGQFYRLLQLLLQSGGAVPQTIHVEKERL